MKNVFIYTTMALAIAAAPALAAGQQTKSPSAVQPSKQFVKSAAEDDLAEVQLAKLAQQQAQSQKVKNFADTLLRDHEKNESQVKKLAQEEGVQMPSTVSEKDQSLKQHLEGLNGASFDRAYIKAMVQDHQKDIAAFKTAEKDNKDPNLQAYAQKTLPVLEQHLRLANQVEAQVVGTSGRK